MKARNWPTAQTGGSNRSYFADLPDLPPVIELRPLIFRRDRQLVAYKFLSMAASARVGNVRAVSENPLLGGLGSGAFLVCVRGVDWREERRDDASRRYGNRSERRCEYRGRTVRSSLLGGHEDPAN